MSHASRILQTVIVAFLGFFPLISSRAAESSRPAKPVYVLFWFDTEDYLLPASDDAAKRLAELLTSKGIRATFKVVGEKARRLESRGRTDVIAALNKHEIGYHANFHSVHPTPSEYLAEAGFLDGIEEFARREGGGAADVRRVFGRDTLVCYGQPGSSWAAQAIAALKSIGVAPHGVPCYVDEGTHVGLNNQPFWFENAVVVYNMGRNLTRMELHDPAALEPAKRKVSEIAERLRGEGGGLISIFYHPCEWVHQSFWDGNNFSRGANPPPEQWKAPPQRPPEETDAAFERFGAWVDHIKSIPGIQFATAADLPRLYPDPLRNNVITAGDLNELAAAIVHDGAALKFRRIGDAFWSPADQFEALARASAARISGKKDAQITLKGIFGPDKAAPQEQKPLLASWSALDRAVTDAADFIAHTGRVPSRVFIGADPVSPANFLEGMAIAWNERAKSDRQTDGVLLGNHHIALDTEKYIARDTPNLFGGWIIHKEGFRAPKIVEIARLQSWTLKPAVLALKEK